MQLVLPSFTDQLDTVLAKEKRLFDLIDPQIEPKLSFSAHFYPEDCSSIIQSVSVHLIFYEVCQKINQSSILCPTEVLAELGALSLAVLYPLGDGKEFYEQMKYKIMPQAHLENVSPHKVLSNYEAVLGKSPADYKRNYLKRAQDLRMYGSAYFNVFSSNGDKWCLCVNAKGIALCLPAQKLEPFTKVLWLEIKSTSYKVRKCCALKTEVGVISSKATYDMIEFGDKSISRLLKVLASFGNIVECPKTW